MSNIASSQEKVNFLNELRAVAQKAPSSMSELKNKVLALLADVQSDEIDFSESEFNEVADTKKLSFDEFAGALKCVLGFIPISYEVDLDCAAFSKFQDQDESILTDDVSVYFFDFEDGYQGLAGLEFTCANGYFILRQYFKGFVSIMSPLKKNSELLSVLRNDLGVS